MRDIELKIKTLSDSYAIVKQQNKQLKQDNISLRQDLDRLSEERMILVRELESAKTHTGNTQQQDKALKSRNKLLSQYIREVDKCIELMQDIA